MWLHRHKSCERIVKVCSKANGVTNLIVTSGPIFTPEALMGGVEWHQMALQSPQIGQVTHGNNSMSVAFYMYDW